MSFLKKDKQAFILFFFLSLGLVVNWFREGLLMGSAESGLPFNDLLFHYQFTSHAWASPVVGNATGMITASFPTYLFLSLLEGAGLSKVLVEALFFLSVVLTSQIATYLFIKEVFPKVRNIAAFSGALFYLFNPVFVFIVWSRFLLNHMLYMAAVPVVFLVFFLGLKKRSHTYSLLTALVLTAFSYVLTSPSFNVLTWGFLLLFGLLHSLTVRPKSKLFFVKYFAFTMLSFIFLNFWWIYLTAMTYLNTISTASSQGFFTSSGNLNVLSLLSDSQGGLQGIFRYVHLDLVNKGSEWMSVYANPLFVALELLLSLLIFSSLLIKRKSKLIVVIAFLYLFSAFLMKGSSHPFREIFTFVFTNFKPFQVLRNPFEKVGFLYVFFSSVLLSASLSSLSEKIKNLLLIKVINVFFILAIFLLGFPLITREVFDVDFGENDLSTRVEVPGYYNEVNRKIENKNSRLLTLPFGGEGITYSWDNPYNGVDLSNTLIYKPNISLNTTIPYYSLVADSLYENQTNKDLFIFTKLFNVDKVLLRKDIDHKSRNMPNPDKTEKFLDSYLGSQFRSKDEFGELTMFNLSEKEIWPKFYTSSNFIFTNSSNMPELTTFENIDEKGLVVLDVADFKQSLEADVLIEPVKFFIPKVPGEQAKFDDQELLDNLFFIKRTPEDKLYALALIKERLEEPSMDRKADWLRYRVGILGKRAAELYTVKNQGLGENLYNNAKNRYLEYLKNLTEEINIGNFSEGLGSEEIVNSFLVQESLLSRVDVSVSEPLSIFLQELELKPKSNLPDSEGSVYVIFQFQLMVEGEYDFSVNQVLKDPKKIFIDGKELETKSFTGVNLPKGKHEIAFLLEQDTGIDQLVDIGSITLSENDIFKHQFTSTENILLNFDFRFLEGNVFNLNVHQDIDSDLSFSLEEKIVKDSYYHDWISYRKGFSPSVGAESHELTIKPGLEEYCIENFLEKQICSLESSKYKVELRNFRISKETQPEMYLKINNGESVKSNSKVSYEKRNNSFYKVIIEKDDPGFEMLVFSELFNPEWKIRGADIEHFRANIYANGWLLEKPGRYELEVYYKPEDYLGFGKKVSLLSFVVVLLLFYFLKKNENN